MTRSRSQVETLLSQLQAAGASYADGAPGSREKLLSLCHGLQSSLESPSEAIMRIGWAEPARAANIRTGVDLDLFRHLKEAGEPGITAKDLAGKCNADEGLIARTMNHLAAMNVVEETGESTYTATPFSEALVESKYSDGIIFLHDVAGVSFQYLPKYLKNLGYQHPIDAKKGPFQAAHNTELPAFAWLDKTPPYLQAFNNYMSAYRTGKPSWVDPGFYPVSERLVQGFDAANSEAFLVDVGGGKGHDLRELRAKHPGTPGKLVLQDRPAVISTLSGAEADGIEAMAHDFFAAQPVRHARAYHLHSILHNWGDEDCVRILRQLQPALKRGYSRLLINEIVVPRRGPTWPVTSMDQLMFVLAGVQERTEAHFADLLRRAGLRIVQVYSCEWGQESLIEAELDEE